MKEMQHIYWKQFKNATRRINSRARTRMEAEQEHAAEKEKLRLVRASVERLMNITIHHDCKSSMACQKRENIHESNNRTIKEIYFFFKTNYLKLSETAAVQECKHVHGRQDFDAQHN